MKKIAMAMILSMGFSVTAWAVGQATPSTGSMVGNSSAKQATQQKTTKKERIYLSKINCNDILKQDKNKQKMQSFFFVDPKTGNIVCLVKAKNQNPNVSTSQASIGSAGNK